MKREKEGERVKEESIATGDKVWGFSNKEKNVRSGLFWWESFYLETMCV